MTAFGYYTWGIVGGVVLGSGPSAWLYLSVVLLGITLPILGITPRLGPVERMRRRLGDAVHRSWRRWYE